MVSEKRFGSIKTSMKVAKIEKKSQQHKENTILKQHQLVWQKEFLRLQHLRKKVFIMYVFVGVQLTGSLDESGVGATF